MKASLNLQFFISIRTLLDQFVLFRPQRGRDGHKCQNLLSKKTTKGEGGGHKIGKMGRRRLWMALNHNCGFCGWMPFFFKDKLFRTPTQMKLSDHKMNELI